MGAHHIGGEYGTGETNRRLVRLFCICLGTLFFAYFILTFRIWLERGTFGALDLFLISVRLLLSGWCCWSSSILLGSRAGWIVKST